MLKIIYFTNPRCYLLCNYLCFLFSVLKLNKTVLYCILVASRFVFKLHIQNCGFTFIILLTYNHPVVVTSEAKCTSTHNVHRILILSLLFFLFFYFKHYNNFLNLTTDYFFKQNYKFRYSH